MAFYTYYFKGLEVNAMKRWVFAIVTVAALVYSSGLAFPWGP